MLARPSRSRTSPAARATKSCTSLHSSSSASPSVRRRRLYLAAAAAGSLSRSPTHVICPHSYQVCALCVLLLDPRQELAGSRLVGGPVRRLSGSQGSGSPPHAPLTDPRRRASTTAAATTCSSTALAPSRRAFCCRFAFELSWTCRADSGAVLDNRAAGAKIAWFIVRSPNGAITTFYSHALALTLSLLPRPRQDPLGALVISCACPSLLSRPRSLLPANPFSLRSTPPPQQSSSSSPGATPASATSSTSPGRPPRASSRTSSRTRP